MSYDNWRRRLEIAKLPTVAARRAAISKLGINFSQPGEADEGYYRKPLTVKDPSGNGKSIITGWVPVAYYMYQGELTGDIGGQPMSQHDVADEQLWSWVVSHPIEYEVYEAVVGRREPWPDLGPNGKTDVFYANPMQEPEPPLDPIERIVGRDHNAPPEVLPEVEHAQAIDNAIGAAPSKVTSEEEASIAAGSMNRIAELRLKAAKAGEARYKPLHAAYVAEREKWLPMVSRAEAAEKKIKATILSFRENERKRIAHLQAEAARRQREQDEANERAAQRAIANGQAEPPPVVEEAAPVAAPAPIVPTYGNRKVKEELKVILDAITDYDAVYQFFKSEPKLKALLLDLATAKVKAGFTVPGTTTREGLI